MATNWKITGVGGIDVTGDWEDKTHTVEDVWENSGIIFAHTAGTSWTFSGRAVAKDSD
jgi:hypothetical protein